MSRYLAEAMLHRLLYTVGCDNSDKSDESDQRPRLRILSSLLSRRHFANHLCVERPPVCSLVFLTRPSLKSSPRAWLMRSALLWRPKRSRISVLVKPADPAALSASRRLSATGSP